MDKDKILDYVMTSPANTNRAVLGDMLDSFEGGSSGGGGGGAEPLIVKYDRTEDEKAWHDKTWKQVTDAFNAGVPIYLQANTDRMYLTKADIEDGVHYVRFAKVNPEDATRAETMLVILLADSADGYLYYEPRGN